MNCSRAERLFLTDNGGECIMNKRFVTICVMAVMLTACSAVDNNEDVTDTTAATAATAAETKAPVNADDYKELYLNKLSELQKSDKYNSSISSFDLYDMDSDGIPELFAALENIHPSNVDIYTVRSGEVIALSYSELGSWGIVKAAEGGYLLTDYLGMGDYNAYYYKYENGELSEILHSEHLTPFLEGDDEDIFSINGSTVSEAEYNEATEKYSSMEWTELGQGHLFDDMDNAKKVIEDYGKK